jgi:hypothetical protein
MIGRKMMQIQRIILVIVIVRRPDTVIIMTADTEIELTEKEDSMKSWKRALDRGMIIGKHDGRRMLRNLCSETSVTSLLL